MISVFMQYFKDNINYKTSYFVKKKKKKLCLRQPLGIYPRVDSFDNKIFWMINVLRNSTENKSTHCP